MPSTSPLCHQPTCPVDHPHAPGLYLHPNTPSPFTNHTDDFGASDPPPAVWMARDRMMNQCASKEDVSMVEAFRKWHYVPPTEVTKQKVINEGEDLDAKDEMMDLETEMMNHAGTLTETLEGTKDDGILKRPPQQYSPRTEAELDNQFRDAFFQMEMEDASEAAAKMQLFDHEGDDDGKGKGKQEIVGEQAEKELVRGAYEVCVQVGRELAREEGEDEEMF
ncbi:MAG: hypothetical protein Q9222_007781 [Ikaeria aurantiellina]